jgi:hypothetical protein
VWQIPCWQGKKQGIFSIPPVFRKIGHENVRKFSRLRVNSLSGEQGIFSRLQGIHSDLLTGAGNWREIDPRASRGVSARVPGCRKQA